MSGYADILPFVQKVLQGKSTTGQRTHNSVLSCDGQEVS
jgi:hypothetical protein